MSVTYDSSLPHSYNTVLHTHHTAFNSYSSLPYIEYREDAYLGWTGSAMRDFLLGRRLSRPQSIFTLLLILVGGWDDRSQHPSVKQESVDTHTAERRVRGSNSQDSDTLAHGEQNLTILGMHPTPVNRILPRVAGCQGCFFARYVDMLCVHK